MKKIIYILLVVFLLMGCTSKEEHPEKEKIGEKKELKTPKEKEVIKDYLKQPLLFIENKGRYPDEVLYYSQIPGLTFFFTKEKLVMAFENYAISLNYIDANPDVIIKSEDETPAKINYFIGNQSIVNVSTYEKIKYTNLYEGIDMVVKSDKGSLKTSFYISAGSDPNNIKLKYEGVDKLEIDDGHLVIHFNNKTLVNAKPEAYQKIDDKIKKIDIEYDILDKNNYAYDIGKYDNDYPLVITS